MEEKLKQAALRLQEGILRRLGRFMDEFGFCGAPVAVYSPVVQKAID